MATESKDIILRVQSDPLVIKAQEQLNEVLAIKQTVFQKGVHYGPPYKGAKNDTLLKPGATFLQQKFQLKEQHERLETTIHVDTNDLSKSYIIIQNRCRLYDADGVEVAQADAACTTFEDKYLFRTGSLVCPDCGKETLRKSKDDSRPGYYCWQKLDAEACGHKFALNDPKIINQEVGKKPNENPLNLLDTIVAMAQKRASVRATIKATGVDALFSPGDGVSVDYYDDLEQANEELITVVSQTAPQSHQDAVSGDLPKAAGDYEVRTPQQRLNGNGAPPAGQKKDSSGKPGYKEGDLLNAVLKDEYGNNPYHMKGSLKKLTEAGLLGPWLTLEQAIEVVKTRKDKTEGEAQS